MTVDCRRFRLNSNKPTDHVVFSYDGAISLDNGYGILSLSHGLSFTPLPFGLISTDGGYTWRDIDFQDQNGFGQLIATSSAITVTINIYGSSLSSAKVRIFAFAPSTVYSLQIAPPTPLSKFLINSNFAHDELLATGRTTLASSNSVQTVYTHNLGYRPRVMLWIENGAGVSRPYQWAKIAFSGYTTHQYPVIDTTKLAFKFYDTLSGGSVTLHWRVYGGQQ